MASFGEFVLRYPRIRRWSIGCVLAASVIPGCVGFWLSRARGYPRAFFQVANRFTVNLARPVFEEG
jgi:hypothetical protein